MCFNGSYFFLTKKENLCAKYLCVKVILGLDIIEAYINDKRYLNTMDLGV